MERIEFMDSTINLAHSYKIFMLTSMIETDIILIKKMNVLLEKYKTQNKISYMFEIINIVKTLNNIVDLSVAKEDILSFIDDKDTIGLLIDNVDNLNISTLRGLNLVSTN